MLNFVGKHVYTYSHVHVHTQSPSYFKRYYGYLKRKLSGSIDFTCFSISLLMNTRVNRNLYRRVEAYCSFLFLKAPSYFLGVKCG